MQVHTGSGVSCPEGRKVQGASERRGSEREQRAPVFTARAPASESLQTCPASIGRRVACLSLMVTDQQVEPTHGLGQRDKVTTV